MNQLAARTGTAADRSAVFASLAARNRIVAVLRIGLPALGAVVLAGLVLQLYIGTLVRDFGFANLSIDRNNLVVEQPAYSGVGSDGSIYSVKADTAKASLANTDLIDLTGAAVSLTQADGTVFSARAAAATLRISDQLVTVAGATEVAGSNGISGTIGDAVVSVLDESLVANGGATLAFGDDATLAAKTMRFSGRERTWTFTDVTLTIVETPGEATMSALPFAAPPAAP
jgi:lipopolysaccharide export system protein LptC